MAYFSTSNIESTLKVEKESMSDYLCISGQHVYLTLTKVEALDLAKLIEFTYMEVNEDDKTA